MKRRMDLKRCFEATVGDTSSCFLLINTISKPLPLLADLSRSAKHKPLDCSFIGTKMTKLKLKKAASTLLNVPSI